MKPSPQPTFPPRWTCRVARAWAAFSNDETASRSLASGHFARCEACQAHYASANALDHSLSRDATAQRVQAPDLETSIMGAIRSLPVERTVVRRRSSHPATYKLAGAFALLAVVFVLGRRPLPTTSTPDPAGGSADVTALLAVAGDFSTRVWSSVQPSAEALTSTNPLQDELNSVYSDAENALDFLALNFLPSSEIGTEHADDTEPQRG